MFAFEIVIDQELVKLELEISQRVKEPFTEDRLMNSTVEGEEMTEKKLFERIEINPKIMLGKPVIKGTRLTVELIVEKIAYGATIAELKRDYPFITENDVKASLLYAARHLAHEEIYELE